MTVPNNRFNIVPLRAGKLGQGVGSHKVPIFGSFLHGDYSDKSDVDLLVELHSGTGFFTLMVIQNRLEASTGRQVQLLTKNSISRYFRSKVLKEAERIY